MMTIDDRADERMSRREILPLTSRALAGVGRDLGPLICLGVVARGLESVLLAPAFSGIVAAIVRRKGRFSVGNTDIVGFLLSPTGIALVIVAGTLVVFAQTAEIAAILVLGRESSEGRPPSFVRACWRTATKLADLLGLALRQWATYVLLLVPFLAILAGVYFGLLSGYDLNYLVESRPPVFWGAVAIAGVVLGCYATIAASLFLKWIFAVPILLFEGKTGAEALKASAARAAGARWVLGWLVVLWVVGTFAANALALWILKEFSRSVLSHTGDRMGEVIPAAGFLVALHALTLAAITFAGNAFAAYLLLQVYEGPAERRAVAVPARLPSRLAVFAAVGAAVSVASLSSFGLVASLEVVDDIQITGHRGDTADAPENSVSAFRQAIDAGADFGELDVQLTSDGQVVVFHDQDLMRLFGKKDRIRDTTLAELQTYDLGSVYKASARYRGESIPTLEQVLDVVGDRIRMMIEIKVYPGDETPSLVAKTLELIARKKIGATCVVTSLDYGALQMVRAKAPAIRTVYLVAESVGDLARLDIDILSLRAALARPALIAEATRRKKPVHAWTVDEPVEMVHLWDLGVANVITNNPRAMLARRAEVRGLTDAERVLLRVRYMLTD